MKTIAEEVDTKSSKLKRAKDNVETAIDILRDAA